MNTKALITFVAVTLGLLLGVGALLTQFSASADKPIEDIAGERRYTRGEGPITLVEFSDFQCPACQAVSVPLKQVLDKFPGKVQFVYRDFPLSSIHKNAQIAAQAAEAAYLQGKFWEFHDMLFAKQGEWNNLDDPTEKFGSYAKDLGMDLDKFSADMNSQAAKDIVTRDLTAANKYRLSGTPSFFLNGVKVEFAQIEPKLLELTQN